MTPVLNRRALTVAATVVLAVVIGITGLREGLYSVPWGELGGGQFYRLDLDVYRIGGREWAAGRALYDGEFETSAVANGSTISLPFTYPPLAAIMFVALTPLPVAAAGLLTTLAGVVFLAIVCGLVAHSAGIRDRRAIALVTLVATAVGLSSEPVLSTFHFGQINLFLMVLVAADLLAPRTFWPRGALIGLAAAIKLTPAVFILPFLVRRRWRETLTTIASAVAFTLLAAVLAWRDSMRYWTETLHDPERIGGLDDPANVSLNGVLAKLSTLTGGSLSDAGRETVWMVLVLLCLAGTWWLIRFFDARGDEPAILFVTALFGLLASPVSWSHHWVWLVPAILGMLLSTGRLLDRPGGAVPARLLALTAVLGLVIVLTWRKYAARTEHAAWEQLGQVALSSSYVLWSLGAVAVAVALAAHVARADRRARTAEAETTG